MLESRRKPIRCWQLRFSHVTAFLEQWAQRGPDGRCPLLHRPVLIVREDWAYYPNLRVQTQGGPVALFASNLRSPKDTRHLPRWNREYADILRAIPTRIRVMVRDSRDATSCEAMVGLGTHLAMWAAGGTVPHVRVPPPWQVLPGEWQWRLPPYDRYA